MNRRHFLQISTAALTGLGVAASGDRAFAQAARSGSKVLRYVPLSDLANLDPIMSVADATRNHAYMIYESLYGLDESYVPRPQMAAGHTVSDDGRTWTFKLRDGLKFHNGEPVLARDVKASLERYNKKILPGITMAQRIESIVATDDKTVTFNLKEAFPSLLWLLAKSTPSVMPLALAETSPNTAIKEAIGSGPFRFMQSEYQPGNFTAYQKFDAYIPRPEPASYTAGGRIVSLDRVEWRSIPDLATVTSALMTGEVDWAEAILPDVREVLSADPGLKVGILDEYGNMGQVVFNHLQGPTANAKIRSAILAALDQAEIMNLAIGDKQLWKAPVGNFAPKTPSASNAGFEYLGTPRRSASDIKKLLAEAGYNNEPVVILHATDHPFYGPMAQVVVSRLREVGFNVKDDIMDRNTQYQRRESKEPIDRGGWSMFVTAGNSFLYFADPTSSSVMRAIGTKGYYGWPTNDKLEGLRDKWLTSSAEDQKTVAAEYQEEILRTAHWAPLGQYFSYSAWRSNVQGIKKSPIPLFWGISKA